MVQIGYDLGTVLGWHSKHSVANLTSPLSSSCLKCTVTCNGSSTLSYDEDCKALLITKGLTTIRLAYMEL